MEKKPINKQIIILFVTLVIIMMGFGMVIPVIPFLVTKFGASGQELGMLMAVYALMQFLFSPMWGELSDRYGRRPIILLGLIGNGLSMLLMGLATEMWMLFAARVLSGFLASATLPTAYAYVSDSTSEEERGGGMGMMGAALGVGMVIGPGFSGLLADISLSTPFFAGAFLSLGAIAVVYFFLPESLSVDNRKQTTEINLRHQIGEMWHGLVGPIGFLLFLAFLISFGLTNFEGIFGLYVARRYDFTAGDVGLILTLIGLISAVVQAMLTGYIIKRWGEVMLIKFSLYGSALGFLLMLTANQLPAILLTVSLYVFSNAMIRPGVSTLISKRATMGQGIAMGLNNSFMSLGRIAGPLLAGYLIDLDLSLPYLMGSLVNLIGFILCLFLLKPTHRSKQPSQEVTTMPPSEVSLD
ncbi:MAG TPA: MFS transporter [Anaerolineales bacterium]|jgi:DHA1 family multidrug resistance protein-like MFS transporter|nr:MFS transporter [Anaerolineales bacterium]